MKPARVAMPMAPLGLPGKSFQGDSFYSAPNPPFGAVITYYLKDELRTKKTIRHEREKEAEKKNGEMTYASLAELRAEAEEEDPSLIVTISDSEGHAVRRLKASGAAGVHRIAWDLRYPASVPTSLKPPSTDPFAPPPVGPMAAPGRYTVSLAKRVDGKLTPLGEPRSFDATGVGDIPAAERAALLQFELKTAKLQRAVHGAGELVEQTKGRLVLMKQSLLDAPGADPSLGDEARAIESRLRDLDLELRGDSEAQRRSYPTPPAIQDRVDTIVGTQWNATSGPTRTSLTDYSIASEDFAGWLGRLRSLVADGPEEARGQDGIGGRAVDARAVPGVETGIGRARPAGRGGRRDQAGARRQAGTFGRSSARLPAAASRSLRTGATKGHGIPRPGSFQRQGFSSESS